MSGFDPKWLALREAVDHRSRDRKLITSLASKIGRKDGISVLDIGCGTGSNLRALAPMLAQDWQSWTLVDHDDALLEAAVEELEDWADDSENFGEELILNKGSKRLTVDLRKVDLNQDMDKVLDWRADLVTAAALFDLVSESWILAFAVGVARRQMSFYTTLTYDGREEWTPAHIQDKAINAAFNHHQISDKGFGPSAGPGATEALSRAFTAAGYHVETGQSDWNLSPQDKDLINELAKGIAGAARETGLMSEADIASWLEAHTKPGNSCLVGHKDFLARPAINPA